MGRNNADLQGGIGKFYAGTKDVGRVHAHTESDLNTAIVSGKPIKSLCGTTLNAELFAGYGREPSPALLDEDEYIPGGQIIECGKCEKAMRKMRGL